MVNNPIKWKIFINDLARYKYYGKVTPNDRVWVCEKRNCANRVIEPVIFQQEDEKPIWNQIRVDFFVFFIIIPTKYTAIFHVSYSRILKKKKMSVSIEFCVSKNIVVEISIISQRENPPSASNFYCVQLCSILITRKLNISHIKFFHSIYSGVPVAAHFGHSEWLMQCHHFEND